MAVVRPGGRIAEANPALMQMFGRTAGEFESVTFPELIHPADLPADSEQARRLLNREIDSYCRENRYRRKDGGWFWGRVTVSLVSGEGDGRFAVVMIEDIDDRKRAEADLSLFRAVMDASHEGVAILSPAGKVLYANSACQRLFSGAGGLIGRDCEDFLPLKSRCLLGKVIIPTLRRGESWEGVVEARGVCGRVFPLWQRSGLVRDAAGKVKYFFAFMHDHSEQEIFERELFNAKETAEAANVAKTRFLAAASHDLRQPMQALGMFVTVLSDCEMDAKKAALVARIQDSVNALEGLLDSLLDVSKLEAGLIVPHKGEVTVQAIMGRLAAEFEPLCTAAGLQLTTVPSSRVVTSDPALLERILRNLLNNAVRYTRTGRILFGCRRRGRMLRFEVHDTGIGIPATEIRNIFREFHQVGNQARDRRQGLGLGLAIVQRLSNLLGHRVDVESREGHGSMFAVEVPLTNRLPAPKPTQLALSLAHRGAAVLVIDDEPDVLDGLRLLLESWGHAVLAAASAEEAIRRLPQLSRDPDLILADYRLGDGDTGGQAIARVRVHLRMKRKVPAIILTGDTAPERLRQAQALGHVLLHKPVEAGALRAAIDECLSQRTVRRGRSKKAGPVKAEAVA